MEFEWDASKSQANYRKHGLDFRDAEKVFQGLVITREDSRKNYGEKRWITMGKLEEITVVIVYVQRGERLRIISMRRANVRERKVYEEKNIF
jgi:uncharacterized DUF497 family protein